MTLKNIGNSTAIAHHIAVEFEFTPQFVLQQQHAGARGRTVQAVISAHHRGGAAWAQGLAKSVKIGVLEVLLIHPRVKLMARHFRPAVHREVLRSGDGFEVMRIVALQAFDEGQPHFRCQIRIFTESFLTPAPARIAKDIDIRRPERQAVIALMIVVPLGIVVFRAGFGGDSGSDAMFEIHVERSRQPDRLREHCRKPGPRIAMQRFVPPIVRRNFQTRNGRGGILHLRNLLFKRHARNKIGRTFFRRQIRIQVLNRSRVSLA